MVPWDRIAKLEKFEHRMAYSVIILFVIILISTGANIAFTLHRASITDTRFCQIIDNAVRPPGPQKPADPAKHPDQELQYERYVEFVRLLRQQGC